MTALRRAFLAVVPPPAARAWAESAAHSAELLAPDLRWARTEQLHLTLQFLGPVDDLGPVAEFVTDSVRPRATFTLSLGGGGAFPEPRRATVVWLGVRDGRDELTDLAVSLASLSGEDRAYRPHVTLARRNRARDVRQVVDALDACGESEPWTVDEVVLFDSPLQADGLHHTEVARFRLAG